MYVSLPRWLCQQRPCTRSLVSVTQCHGVGVSTGASHASHLGNCCPSAYSSRLSYIKKRQVWNSWSETDSPHLEITPDFSTEKNHSILFLTCWQESSLSNTVELTTYVPVLVWQTADVKTKLPNHGASRDLLYVDRQWNLWNFQKPAKKRLKWQIFCFCGMTIAGLELSFLGSGQPDHQFWRSGGLASILVVQWSFSLILTKLHSTVYIITSWRKGRN